MRHKPRSGNAELIKRYMVAQAGEWICVHTCARGTEHRDDHHENMRKLANLGDDDSGSMELAQAAMQTLWLHSSTIHPTVYGAIYANLHRVLS
jgi:hypothetical protein